MVRVGVSVILRLAFSLFNVLVCLDCGWLCAAVWFGCFLCFVLCVFVCALYVRVSCVMCCVVVWFVCVCDLCCACVRVLNCVCCVQSIA